MKNRSAKITRNVDRTTAEVVERPTASGPPRTLNSFHASHMDNDGGKGEAFNQSTNNITQQNRVKCIPQIDSQCHSRAQIHESSAARMPKTVHMMVRQGTMIMAAVFSRQHEFNRIECQGSQCVDFACHHHGSRISAENADPERPLTTIAVKSGPSSRVKPIAAGFEITYRNAPKRRSSPAPCSDRISPEQLAIMAMPWVAPRLQLRPSDVSPRACVPVCR